MTAESASVLSQGVLLTSRESTPFRLRRRQPPTVLGWVCVAAASTWARRVSKRKRAAFSRKLIKRAGISAMELDPRQLVAVELRSLERDYSRFLV